ncbi:MAG: tripartite tricarboxylate transporter substrate binding protein, partial [Betaproteobacteria bacterium]|nr:tripartite tricarboxylate transporter substrate binding protein [Betaproteobacteria bacterium]
MKRLLVALALAGACGCAVAQDAYPSRTITLVNPFPPGGVVDIVGRPLAALMEKSLRQPVIMQNKTGAGGSVGMASVAKAVPDGYTILMG